VVTEYAGVEWFAALAVNMGEESFRSKKIIYAVGASGVSRFFNLDTVTESLDASKMTFVNDLSHAIQIETDCFV
jgi:hypothetical protein